MIQNNLGMLYADLRQYDKSLESFTKTLASRKSNNEKIGIISALINRAVVLNNLKKHDKAIEDLQEALTIARGMNDIAQMKSVYGMLSETYEKNGQVDLSLKYFELYRTFHEEVNKNIIEEVNEKLVAENIQKKLAEAEINAKELELLKNQMKLAEKEREISSIDSINQSLYKNLSRAEIELQLLEKDAKLKEQVAILAKAENESLEKQQRLVYLITFIIILSFIIITIISFWNYRRVRKVNNKLKSTNLLLSKQKTELAEANDIKTKLFTIIAHDFRSPLYALKSLFLVVDDYEMPEEIKKPMEHLKIQLINTTSLVENLLNWSKTQMASPHPKIEIIQVSRIVDENIALVSPMAQNKGITLQNKSNELAKVIADQGMLQVVIRNLIQNALKFTSTGGSVTVYSNETNENIEISVEDTGVGMSAEQIEKIFKFKAQESSLGTDDEPGSGLGLYLCAELIKKNNGSIKVESTPKNGSTFTFSLKKST
jgi:two-component system sensor histidine kinase/response regulator